VIGRPPVAPVPEPRTAEEIEAVEAPAVRADAAGSAQGAALAAPPVPGRAIGAGFGAGPPTGGPRGPAVAPAVRTRGAHRPTGRMPRLHARSHVASAAALALISMPASGSGMVLGVGPERRPATVRFFRSEPTRVTLVGGAWAGWFLTFRALALGARVAVITDEPQQWRGFGERATGRSDGISVFGAERPLTPSASPHQPVLLVYDLGLAGPTVPPQLGPWQTQLVVLRQLGSPGIALIQDCDLAVMQRLFHEEAELAASALRLGPETVRYLQLMGQDAVALWGGGSAQYIQLGQTDIERDCIGLPRR
jgi:ESX secretion system protein EccE